MMAPSASMDNQRRARLLSAFSILLSLAFYAFCIAWMVNSSETLSEAFRFPTAALLVPVIASVLINMLLRPWKYHSLLGRFGLVPTYIQSLKDRSILLASKWMLPFFWAEPLAMSLVTRKWRMSFSQVSALWITDKSLGVLAEAVLLFGALLMMWMPGWSAGGVTLLAAGVLLLLIGRPSNDTPTDSPPNRKGLLARIGRNLFAGFRGVGGLKAYSYSRRVHLALATIGHEAAEIACFGITLSLATGCSMSALSPLDLVLLNAFASLPLSFGGFGSREAGAVVLFSHTGDPRAICIAAFLTTVMIRFAPALPGILFVRSALADRQPETSHET